MYTENHDLIPEYRQLAALAFKHRENVVPYPQSRRILDSEDFGIFLTAKKYYNLVRMQKADKSNSESIVGLPKALDDAKFVHHQRVSTKVNDQGEVTEK